jgi:branched-chain amino acid transport system substrate-binding protein
LVSSGRCQLALKTLGGKISGLDTKVIVVGEELKPEGAVNKIQKKLDRDKIDFVVGPIFFKRAVGH